MDPQQRVALEREVRVRVVRKMRARAGFMWHAAAFVVTNIMLALINLRFSPSVWWFVWALGGWGIGLAFHALAVFGTAAFTGAAVETEVRRVLKERERMKG